MLFFFFASFPPVFWRNKNQAIKILTFPTKKERKKGKEKKKGKILLGSILTRLLLSELPLILRNFPLVSTETCQSSELPAVIKASIAQPIPGSHLFYCKEPRSELRGLEDDFAALSGNLLLCSKSGVTEAGP